MNILRSLVIFFAVVPVAFSSSLDATDQEKIELAFNAGEVSDAFEQNFKIHRSASRFGQLYKKKKKQDWCVFYTPMGRMVTKPSGKRPRNMHPEDWCADKTPFRGKVVRSY